MKRFNLLFISLMLLILTSCGNGERGIHVPGGVDANVSSCGSYDEISTTAVTVSESDCPFAFNSQFNLIRNNCEVILDHAAANGSSFNGNVDNLGEFNFSLKENQSGETYQCTGSFLDELDEGLILDCDSEQTICSLTLTKL